MSRSISCFAVTLSTLCISAVLAGCGGSKPAAAGASGPGAAPADAATTGSASDVWHEDMSDKLKADFMKKKVVPPMAKTFQAFDAQKYSDFGCKTCHGADFKEHPDDYLSTLHMKDGKFVEAEKNPAMAKFMMEQVAPQMAEIFGMKPYNPETREGFGCGGCHKIEM